MFARALLTTALAVCGLLGAIAVFAEPGGALTAIAFGAIVGLLAARWARTAATGDATSRARAGRRAGMIVGAGVTGGWLSLTGLVMLMGSASGPALLLLMMITLSAWWWHRRRRSGRALLDTLRGAGPERLLRAAHRPDPLRQVPHPRRGKPSAPVVVPAAPTPASVPIPATLSTPQLCLAWQRTYFALLDLPAGAPRDDVVALRGRLLDEIERRDPAGFTRWLDTGARAGSDPGRYLAGGR